MIDHRRLSTGIPSLDGILQSLLPGDNLVWQVATVEDYVPFALRFCQRALREGRRTVYFRFAPHAPLLSPTAGLEIIELHPTAGGFEPFVRRIHEIIMNGSRDAIYIFDCLSELAADWCSDRMLGNFFMLTCPYVFDHGAGAYFALIRNTHSFHAIDPVRQTTQIFIDVHRHAGKIYIHPRKVQHRHSSTMYRLHVADEDLGFTPVRRSATAAELFAGTAWDRADSWNRRLGFWSQTFAQAEARAAEIAAGSPTTPSDAKISQQLRRMLIAREGPILKLAERYLGLSELLHIRQRMIGTGPIGGKSLGLSLALAILYQADPKWQEILEPPDNFHIGADVFYTFLVQNGLWWLKQQQKDPSVYLDGLTLARNQILNGKFPEYLMRQFQDLVDYYGQAPIIVRSSSLLEDDFESSFAGKAESILCANQGSLSQRVEDFVNAIRQVYASNMSEAALRYRAARKLLDRDEQMAILVQRVSGVTDGKRMFPHVAGVGLSFNPYVWDERVDPQAGVLRLVCGLGTRAVLPHTDDYSRLVALNAPTLQPNWGTANSPQTQQNVDVLDLDSSRVIEVPFEELIVGDACLPMDLLAERDPAMERRAREQGLSREYWRLSLQGLLVNTDFTSKMRALLQTLAQAYGSSVDVEFAMTFDESGSYQINLLQCRPFLAELPDAEHISQHGIKATEVILKTTGPVIGRSRRIVLDRILIVLPEVYGKLPNQDRYAVARFLGDQMRRERAAKHRVMLIGPGRWGTTSPSLGVPTSFAELDGAAALCEVLAMHEGLNPDLSLGSHFFHELVESHILYFAVDPKHPDHKMDLAMLASHGQRPETAVAESNWAAAIRVVDAPLKGSVELSLCLLANTPKQEALLFSTPCDKNPPPPCAKPDGNPS